ncbi:MAG: GerMN domain-containing protein [Herbinix sp.]|nr:GerMN domain-containing protein [Herbinix sp.]
MGQYNKKFLLITMLISIFLLTGCDKFSFGIFNASKEETNSEVTVVPEENQNKKDKGNTTNSKVTISPSMEATVESTLPTQAVIQPAANLELPVYTVNAEQGNLEPVTARVEEGSELTPELIVNTVVEALADQSITIGIDSVTTDKDAVIVSFKKDESPASNMGSGYEGAIMDAIAQSLIDNLDDYSKVIFRIEGKAYVSGVFEMDINDVYMQK